MLSDIMLAVWGVLPFTNPASPFFWPYLLGSSLFVMAILAVRGQSVLADQWQALRSPSARIDLAFFLMAIPVVTLGLSPLVTLLQEHVGTSGSAAGQVATWQLDLLYTLILALAFDVGYFLCHYALHRIPVLWRFHRVHHSAERLSPLTSARSHPVDIILILVGCSLTTGVAHNLFIVLFPGYLEVMEIAGINLFFFLFYLTGYHLRHSEIPLSYGSFINHLLISPIQHQFHHSDDSGHHHKNLGLMLAIWDWLAGTLYIPRAGEPVRFGLPDEGRSKPPSLCGWLFEPVLESWRLSRVRTALLFTVLVSPIWLI